MSKLNSFIQKIESCSESKVLVVGDIILDKYIFGSVDRISPEAPVVIHRAKSSSYSLGGAANVALNIKGLTLNADLFGRVGPDQDGNTLINLLKDKNINHKYVVQQKDYTTTLKTRILSSSQQLIRLDDEQTNEWQEKDWIDGFNQVNWSDYTVVVVSDYQKGTITPEFYNKLYKKTKAHNIKLIVDPKYRDFEFYRSPYLITPNKKEALAAIDSPNEVDDLEISSHLVKKFGMEHALVTLSSKGMQLVDQKLEAIYLPACAIEVFDVSGAGDTVVAAMAVGLALGLDHETCLILANESAGVVIAKVGTQPISLSELKKKMTPQLCSTQKNYKINDLEKLLSSLKYKNKKVVFTNGCFDILHAGHVDYLQKARNLGDVLVLGLNKDDSITRSKGSKRPINKFDDRLSVLSALSSVDFIVGFDSDTPLDLIKALKPDVLVKGSDWQIEDIVGGDIVTQNGGEVKTVPLLEGRSTTSMIKKIIDAYGVEEGE